MAVHVFVGTMFFWGHQELLLIGYQACTLSPVVIMLCSVKYHPHCCCSMALTATTKKGTSWPIDVWISLVIPVGRVVAFKNIFKMDGSSA